MQIETPIPVTEETRVCSNPTCVHGRQPQPLDASHFAPNSNYAGGYKTRCRDCERQTRRDRYKRKREEELAYNRQWVANNRDERNSYQRERNGKIMEVYRAATTTGKEQTA